MPVEPRITSVNVLHTLGPTPKTVRQTAIDKRPVPGDVAVGTLGLAGDRQMDTKHHGGPTQAVYAYAAEDLAWWSGELERDMPPGFFGENLTTAGIALGSCVQGEQWRVGDEEDAQHVVLQVTDARIPCATFAYRMQVRGWLRRFADHGESGTYLAVVKPGVLRAGAPVTVVQVPDDGETIRDQFARVMGRADR